MSDTVAALVDFCLLEVVFAVVLVAFVFDAVDFLLVAAGTAIMFVAPGVGRVVHCHFP